MAASGTEYTVFGYGSGFDGRPTVFVTAFPPTRVCSACGLVPSTAGLLPCRHVLCQRCYEQCIEDERSHCPLDRHAFQGEDVVWSTFSKDNILDRKVQCWNASNGCDAVGPASEILEHFGVDCHYYPATCERCRRTIAQKEVVDHVKSRDCVREPPRTTPTFEGMGASSLLESLQSLDNRLTESTRLSLDAIKDILAKQTSLESSMGAVRQFFREEVAGILRQVESRVEYRCSENAGKILAACSTIETLTNALKAASLDDKQETVKALKTLEEAVTKGSVSEEKLAKLKTELAVKCSVVMAASKAVLENFGELKSSEPLEWTVENWSKLKDMQKRGEAARYWAKKPGFFYGYSILPGAEIAKIEEVASLRLVFRICKGQYDVLLTWPFGKELHFKALHPDDKRKVQRNASRPQDSSLTGLQMPTSPQGEMLVAAAGLVLTALEADGYVKNDKIFIRFEVLP
ncbi:TNF receptor-associated factor 3-like [Haemaphysalis longicornis]